MVFKILEYFKDYVVVLLKKSCYKMLSNPMYVYIKPGVKSKHVQKDLNRKSPL